VTALSLVNTFTAIFDIEWNTLQNIQNTHAHIASITFWQGELLMNRLALLIIAISIAFPTLSSISSLSSLACAISTGSHPEYTAQLVVIAKAKSSMLSACSRIVRMASISHKAARERDNGAVVRFSSRTKRTRLIRKQKTTDLFPAL
jgi:hypothetical protein